MGLGRCVDTPEVVVRETWIITDKWWLPKDEQIRREFADVKWNGRKLVFMRELPDTVWRIFKGLNGKETAT